MTLKLADFLIENNMIDDVIYKKILADLDSWNIYDTEQILHNKKVSEYNYIKYIIYNMKEAESRLWYIPFSDASNRFYGYLFLTKYSFDKDLTHIWLKNILKYDKSKKSIWEYIWYRNDSIYTPSLLILNPEFNNYGIGILSTIRSYNDFLFLYRDINNTFSYRDTIIQKYKNYTPIVIRDGIKTDLVIDLSWWQDILWWIVLEVNNITWSTDSSWLNIKKDFAYCQQFKNKISVYMKCIKSIE
jgi:hypothetical protein